MTAIPKIISVDDHVVEPPDLWSSRLPSHLVDRGPRVVREQVEGNGVLDADGRKWADVWYYDDLRMPLPMAAAAAGSEEKSFRFTTYDAILPGAWEQSQRLADMVANHTDASVCFPNTLPRFCGQTFAEREDKDLALLCVQAYNDWIIDDWCAGEGRGRLIPVTIVPLWDPALAAAEVRRCAEKCSFAVSFSENPFALGLPSIHSGEWKPLFTACEETESTLCLHIGSSSRMPGTTPDAPFIISSTLTFQNAMGSVLDYTFGGTLAEHPNLKVAYSEGQVGWLPYVLERADKLWEERQANSFGSSLPAPPSTYIRRQVWACVFDDEVGLRNRDLVGIDRICYETDYPHADSTFPHSGELATRQLSEAGLDEHEAVRILRTNAIEAFGLDRFGIES